VRGPLIRPCCARQAGSHRQISRSQSFNDWGEPPLFNPDLEMSPPANVMTLYRAVVEADALLIASPEYAHGVSGPIKNALDWLVGFEPFAGKCVAVLNASPRAHHADAHCAKPFEPWQPRLSNRLQSLFRCSAPALTRQLLYPGARHSYPRCTSRPSALRCIAPRPISSGMSLKPACPAIKSTVEHSAATRIQPISRRIPICRRPQL